MTHRTPCRNRCCEPDSTPEFDTLMVEGLATVGCLVVDTDLIFADCLNNFVGINNASPTVALDVVGDFRVDNNTFYVDSTLNFVGINASSPSFSDIKHEINGNVFLTSSPVDTPILRLFGTQTLSSTNDSRLNISGVTRFIANVAHTYLINDTDSIQVNASTSGATFLALQNEFGNTGGTTTITDVNSLYIQANQTLSDLTTTNYRGIFIDNPTHDTILSQVNNVFGLYVDNMTIGLSSNYAIFTNTGFNRFGDRIGILENSPTALLHANQSNNAGAIPVIHVEQDDVSEEFIRFTGTSASANLTQSVVDNADVAVPTIIAWVKVNLQDEGNNVADGSYFMPLYSLA